jgi:hypothetical protein
LLVAAAAVLLLHPVLASGRAGTRFEVGDSGQFTIRIYAEQVLWRLGNIEVTSGVDARFPEGLVTPYTAFNWYGDRFWVSVEVASDVRFGGGFDAAFKTVFMFGALW